MNWTDVLEYVKTAYDAAGGLKSINEALDIGKKIKELAKTAPKADDRVAELRGLVFDLQDKMLDAREQSIELRRQLIGMVEAEKRDSEFVADRPNFERVELAANSFVYRRKQAPGGNPDPAFYCCHCFEQERRVVTLQHKDWTHVGCTACQRLFYTDARTSADLRPVVLKDDYNPFS